MGGCRAVARCMKDVQRVCRVCTEGHTVVARCAKGAQSGC